MELEKDFAPPPPPTPTDTQLIPHFEVDLSEFFTTDQIFNTREEVIDWARSVGKSCGVVVLIKRSDKLVRRGTCDRVIFCCDRQGRWSNKDNVFGSKQTCCPFRLRAVSTIRDGGWKIQVRNGLHNHPLRTNMLGSLFGQLKKEEKMLVNQHLDLDVPAKKTLLALKKQDPKNVSTIFQVYRQMHKYRYTRRRPRTDLQEVMRLVDASTYLCWSRKMDGSDVVSDIMWAHPTSIKLFRLFPKVLILDSTYKTNKYGLPLLQIVGVTNTNLSFQIAFAYLGHELTTHFYWVLQQLKEVCDLHGLLPKIILTDRDLGTMAAIRDVFPSSTNLLCHWHVTKNVKAKIKEMVHKDRRDDVIAIWHNIVDSPKIPDFELNMQVLMESCADIPSLISYVSDTWIKDHKERFICSWTNQHPHLGNLTTNRAESSHAMLKRHLRTSMGDLSRCFGLIDELLTVHFDKVIESFQKSIDRVEVTSNIPLFSKLRGVVSLIALRIMAAELERSQREVGYDKGKCGCLTRKVYQIPCACEIGIFFIAGTAIPLDTIDEHWKRLSLDVFDTKSSSHGSSTTCDISMEIEGIFLRFNKMTEDEKFLLKKALRELAFPSTSSLVAPLHKSKTKGAPKKKKSKLFDTKRLPSKWEITDE